MFMIYTRTKFQVTNSNRSFDTVTMSCPMSVFYVPQQYYHDTSCICFQELLPYATSDLKVNVASVAAASQVRTSAMLLLMIVGYYFYMPSDGVTFISVSLRRAKAEMDGRTDGHTHTHTHIYIYI